MKGKVVLIVPNTRWASKKEGYFYPSEGRFFFPIGVAYLKAALDREFDVSIIDANIENFTLNKFKKNLKNAKPAIIGISSLTTLFKETAEIASRVAKEIFPRVPVVMGGPHVTMFPDAALKDRNTDYLILSEGEETFPQLCDYLINGRGRAEFIDGIAYRRGGRITINRKTRFIENLNSLPRIDYKGFEMEKYLYHKEKYNPASPAHLPAMYLSTSRGCTADCIYCLSKFLIGHKFRAFSAERVLDEIEYLVANYGIKEVIFNEDNLTADYKRAEKIFNGMIERKFNISWKAPSMGLWTLDEKMLELMKASGCSQITAAIESGVDRVLKLMRKPLTIRKVDNIIAKMKKMEFKIAGFFILGMPGETKKDILETVDYAERLDLDYVAFSIMTPYVGTDLYDLCTNNGWFVPVSDTCEISVRSKGFIRTPEFSPEFLEEMRVEAWDKINFASHEKKKRVCDIMNIDMKELNAWRRRTKVSLLKEEGYTK